MNKEPISIGCNIYDFDTKNASNDEINELKELIYKNRIVIIKNQELSEKELCDFSYKLGDPIPYLQENYHHPDYPLIFVSSNVKKDEKRIGVPRTGGYWHSDTSFEKDPKFLTMLMPNILPEKSVRTTRFIDMSKVYNTLSDELKQKITGETFLHSGRWRYKVRVEDAGLDISEILEMIDHYAPPVEHPAVITHPYTKEKVIYGNRGFTIGIKDKGLDESKEILNKIFDFSESEAFVKEVAWEKGDLIIWDNRFLSHSSGRKKAPTENIHDEILKEEETMMYRITLKDNLPLTVESSPELEKSNY